MDLITLATFICLLLLPFYQIGWFLISGKVVSENVSSIERVEPWFFVTFNIILKHIFPENFIEFPQVVQKI